MTPETFISHEKAAGRLETVVQVAQSVSELLAHNLCGAFDYRGAVNFDEAQCREINDRYWELVLEFKKHHSFGRGLINNPKIAGLTVYCACVYGPSAISVPGHHDYEEYANVMFCKQLMLTMLLCTKKHFTQSEWDNLALCFRELRRYKPTTWQPIIPLLVYRFETIWDRTRRNDKAQQD